MPQLLGDMFLERAHNVGSRHPRQDLRPSPPALESAGLGLPRRRRPRTSTARASAGTHFVIEGDEYDTAFFDKLAKFLYYRPDTAILTSVSSTTPTSTTTSTT